MSEAHDAGWIAPPKAVKGPVPKLTALWSVERALHDAWIRDDGPLTFDEVRRRLRASRIGRAALQICIDELVRQGKVTATATGVMWTLASPAWEKYARSRSWQPL